MFELYRETIEGEQPEAGDDAPEPANAKWRWQLTAGEKVLARSEDSWTKRSAAKAAVDKLRGLVASAGILEKLS